MTQRAVTDGTGRIGFAQHRQLDVQIGRLSLPALHVAVEARPFRAQGFDRGLQLAVLLLQAGDPGQFGFRVNELLFQLCRPLGLAAQLRHLAVGNAPLRLELAAGLGNLALQLGLLGLKRRVARQFLVPGLVGRARRLQLSVAGLDLVLLREDHLGARQRAARLGKLILRCCQLALAVCDTPLQIGQRALLGAQLLLLAAQRLQRLVAHPQFLLQVDHGLLRQFQLALIGRLVGQFRVDFADQRLGTTGHLALLAGALLRATLELVVQSQPQNIGQYLLALVGWLDGELVGFALHQIGGVDEGVIVHAQELHNARLGVTQRRLSDRLPRVVAARHVNLQLQVALAAPFARPAAHDPVAIGTKGELEIDPHICFAQVYEVVGGRRARLAPQRPRHGIQQRRLAVAVVARQAGQVQPGEVQRVRVLVAKEVMQRKFERNHGKVSSKQ